ncbi:hypothetical protein ACH41H_43900 [Streptomyces sp. NPDC020800]
MPISTTRPAASVWRALCVAPSSTTAAYGGSPAGSRSVTSRFAYGA